MSRRRRLWRGLVLTMAGLLLVLVVAAIGLRVYGSVRLRRAERLFTAEVGPLDSKSYAPPAVTQGRNAANVLLGGARAIVLAGDDEDRLLKKAYKEPPPVAWTSADMAGLRELLKRNAAALAVLREARSYPDANLGIPYRDGLQAKLPNLVEARRASRMLAADTAVALIDGDLDRAVVDVETLGAQARAYSQEASLIVFIVGMAIERDQLGAAALVVSSTAVDIPMLARVRASLLGSDLAGGYRRAIALDAAHIAETFRNPPPDDKPVGFTLVAPLAAAETLDRTRLMGQALSGTSEEIRRHLADLQGEESFLIGKWFVGIPNLVNGAKRATATESQRRMAAAAIDLRLEALRTGHYPDVLPPQHAGPEPFLGERPRYARLPDGSVSLDVPGAAETWKELAPNADRFLWKWMLPAASHRS